MVCGKTVDGVQNDKAVPCPEPLNTLITQFSPSLNQECRLTKLISLLVFGLLILVFLFLTIDSVINVMII